MINPLHLIEMKSLADKLRRNHPKFPAFLQAVMREGLKPDCVVELKVTEPDGREYITNVRITEEDLSCIERLTELARQNSGK